MEWSGGRHVIYACIPYSSFLLVRFKVRCAVWLPLEKTIPIHEPEVYSHLTFTRDVKPGGYWLGPLRRSLVKLNQQDGELLDSLLQRLQAESRTFPVDSEQYDLAFRQRIQRPDRSVVVSVPDDRVASHEEPVEFSTDRESVRVQAALCRIGEAMGFKIWLPNADRSRVAEHWSAQPGVLLERLPLNYDETTLDTIKRIDVLWLKGRAIRRAFEVEHSTATTPACYEWRISALCSRTSMCRCT